MVQRLVHRRLWVILPAPENQRKFRDYRILPPRLPPTISPLLKAVKRTDAIFDLERTIEGAHIATRLAALREEAAPRVADLELWMRSERKTPLPPRDVAQAMDHMLKRWDRFTRILDGGRRICLINNAAERALRGAALGRKA